jgi:chromosome segregation ATPase
LKAKLAALKDEVETARQDIEKRDTVISHQQETVDKLRHDLKESVKKTRDLRTELSDRATENMRSEVKQRELETELSVARASTDMIATGVLDYSMNDDVDDDLQEVFAASAFSASKSTN